MEKKFLGNAGNLFAIKRGPKPAEHASEEALYGEIRRLKMELDWLKKVRTMSMDTRMSWSDPSDEIKLAKQCELAAVCRSSWYNRQSVKPMAQDDTHLCRLIDEAYTKYPFYGSRRMMVHLFGQGIKVNRKRAKNGNKYLA